ncbi:Tudor and KH domain-containing protein [Melipona quadrifasciata]|uniref:Tudor and KH domain-containing protein n=1 Tax=Melipona quadrifasciata TaxID=166423 RepID=A0A0M8ZX48_9HYME|nr:Tudor and KH domain-containing protein [Melipona quadrifasciata]
MINCIIKNQPIIEVSPLGVRRKIIKDASKFNNIQEMEDLSGPTITIVHPYNLYYPDSDKKVFIKGTTQEIATIITQIKNNSRAGIEACAKDRYVEKFCSTVFNARGQSYYAGFLPLYYEDLIQVYVTAKKNPHQFWVQVVDPDIKIFDKLMSEMTTYYNNKVNYEMHKLIDIAVDRLVAVKSDTRGKWCRGKIVSKVAKNVCKVRLMDYGDSEVATLNDVLEIRDNFLVLRFQAIECSLDNIKPPSSIVLLT